jgi:hypothetical protein
MVARQTLDLEGIYIVEEHDLPDSEDDDFERFQSQESLELDSTGGPQHRDSYNFDDCYSDDSSFSEDEDDVDSFRMGPLNQSLHLQQWLDSSRIQGSSRALTDFEDLDNDSILTFNSFKNASRRGVRKTNLFSGSVRESFYGSFQSVSVSIDESVTVDEDEFLDILASLTTDSNS